jgi:hypothetical protein
MHAETCTIQNLSGLDSTVNPNRNKISYQFTPIPTALVERGVPHGHRCRGFVDLLIEICHMSPDGKCYLSQRELASKMGIRSQETIRLWSRILERLRIIKVTVRRVGIQCLTNIIEFIGFRMRGGAPPPSPNFFGRSTYQSTNTTTPRPSAPAQVDQVRETKDRQAQESPAMRKLYEWNGVLQARLRSLGALTRNRREEEQDHMAVMAQVGVYKGPCTIPEDEQEQLRVKHGW